jgi:ubiquinone biosynthesis protein
MLVNLRRLLLLLLALSRHAALLLASWLLPRQRRRRGPKRLQRLLEELGGTFLKLGQVLALQPDIIPREYCNALFDLLDKVPPFAYSEVERIFHEELGRSPNQVFDSMDATPIASASIGQVHVAWNGEQKLAVKVRRPAIEKVFAADLRLLQGVAWLIKKLRLIRLYWLVRAIRELGTWTWEELDYRYEARFMTALGYNARNSHNEAVPQVLEEYTTSRILVAEFLDGPMMVDYIRSLERGDHAMDEELQAAGFEPEEFARHIVENFVSDAFHHGLFHADLHPANLLILRDNVVGYVDFGITGSLSRYSRRNLVALTLAMTRADTDAMMTFFLRISTSDPSADTDAFRRGLQRLVDTWCRVDGGVHPVLEANFTQIMLDLLKVSRETGVWPTPDVIRYLRSVITADGLIARFAPDLDVSQYLEQVCEEYLHREMLQEWLSAENVADWTAAAVRALRRVPATMATVLRQVSRADLPPPSAEAGGESTRAPVRPSLQLALVALVSALLSLLEPPLLGANLFTVELATAVIAATMVVTHERR